ncbi:MAG: hypothetical protein SO238_04245 [Treponema sp.]|nr:hypothetical protein [Treponema sp.]
MEISMDGRKKWWRYISLFICIFSMIIGIPVLAMELAIERAAGKSANMNMGAMVSSPLINVLCMFFTLT